MGAAIFIHIVRIGTSGAKVDAELNKWRQFWREFNRGCFYNAYAIKQMKSVRHVHGVDCARMGVHRAMSSTDRTLATRVSFLDLACGTGDIVFGPCRLACRASKSAAVRMLECQTLRTCFGNRFCGLCCHLVREMAC